MRKAFTLIEVMVVMAIIAVLAVLIIGAITIARRTATESTHRSNAKIAMAGLERAYALNRRYPGNDGTFVSFECACLIPYINAALADVPECSSKSINGHSVDGGGYIQYTGGGYTIYIANHDCTAVLESIVNH